MQRFVIVQKLIKTHHNTLKLVWCDCEFHAPMECLSVLNVHLLDDMSLSMFHIHHWKVHDDHYCDNGLLSQNDKTDNENSNIIITALDHLLHSSNSPTVIRHKWKMKYLQELLEMSQNLLKFIMELLEESIANIQESGASLSKTGTVFEFAYEDNCNPM